MNTATMTHYPYGEPWSQPQGQPWLFGGKEREQRHHLGDSDFGARTYNAARATFAQPDPLAEKYYPINPYTFCAADPINHIDPSGMKFTEIMSEYVTALRTEITTILQNNEYAEGTDEHDYLKIQVELNEMEKSDQLFDIQNWDRIDIGATIYNYEQNAVVFVFPKSNQSLALYAHEFTHGYQFLMSKIALAIYDENSDHYVQERTAILNDIDNERQAYKRGYMFGGDSFTDDQIVSNCDYKFTSEFKFKDEANGVYKLDDYMKYPDYDIKLMQLATFTNCVFRLNGTTYKPLTKRNKKRIL